MPIHAQRTFELSDLAVGDILTAARVSRSLSLRAAGELAGIDWRVLGRIELGHRPCRVTEFVALSDAYQRPAHIMLQAVLGDKKSADRIRTRRPLKQ